MNFDRIVILIFLIAVFFRTASYAAWTWQQENRLGGIMIYLVAAATVLLPVYTLFFRS